MNIHAASVDAAPTIEPLATSMGLPQQNIAHALSYLRGMKLEGRVLCLGNQSCGLTFQGAVKLLAHYGFVPMNGVTAVLDSRTSRHIKRLEASGKLLSPFAGGRAKNHISCMTLFHLMGFDDIDIIDNAPMEGVNLQFDLNRSDLADATDRRYRLICDGGTLEHIFNVPNALKSVLDVLEVGGIAWHMMPVNGQIDHGFYQFSPTLIRDFYVANGFEFIALDFVEVEPSGDIRVQAYPPAPETCSRFVPRSGATYACFALMRKRATSTTSVAPQQSHYVQVWRAPRADSLGGGGTSERDRSSVPS